MAISVEIRKIFTHHVYFSPLLKGFHLELGDGYRRSGSKNYNDGATWPRKKFDDIFSRLDKSHQRDRRTDGHATAKTALTHAVARKNAMQ